MKAIFNKLVKEALKKEKISLRELARQTGLDVSFLSKILNGKRNPPSDEKDILKMAKILSLNPDRLLFSAGRIPTRLQHIFNDESFISSLTEREKIPKEKPVQKNKLKTLRAKDSSSRIEDELL